MSDTIILTDTPERVELKRQFRLLDEQEEGMKMKLQILRDEMERIRAEKRRLAVEIFNQ